jgi:Ca2+-transporting ATPase
MPELIARFRAAGIKPMMITGDHRSTAAAVAGLLSLNGRQPLGVVGPQQLSQIESDILNGETPSIQVFARVSPADKLRIVRALQSSGNVIAMTGDGINDGPALRAADLGVTMGRSGTDVARAAADVVLEHDDLDAMIAGVAVGRASYDNIRKSVRFLLTTNLSELMLMGTAIGFGLVQPLTPMQLLWINLITDVLPGLALAMELPEPDVLRRPPRDPNWNIFRRKELTRMTREAATITGAALAASAYGAARYGLNGQASTLGFMTLTTAQLLHAPVCRSERLGLFSREGLPPNRWLTWSVGLSLAVQGMSLFIPGLRRLLGTVPIGPADGLVVAGASVLPWLLAEGAKQLRASDERADNGRRRA